MPQGVPIELRPPLGGVRGDVVPYEIPPGFLWRSLNAVDRFGRLRTRQGLRAAALTGPGGRIMGGQTFNTAGALGRTVAATRTGWHSLAAAGWANITGTPLTGTEEDHVRFAVFPSAGINWLIGVNNVEAPQKWDGTAPTYVPLGGAPPIARDVTVSGNFVVLGNVVEGGIRSPSRIRVSDFNNLDLWTQYGPIDLTDTNDEIVAVRGLTRTTFAVYKTLSTWIAYAQLGLFPFAFEIMERRPGPCSPAAVVTVDQEHYYFGTDGRIHKFDGARAEVVSRQAEYYLLTPGLATSFRSINRARCWGVYSVIDRTVWFFFPGPGADPTLALSLNVDTGAVYPHAFPFPITAGWIGDDVSSISWDDLLIYPDWVGGAFEATYPDWDSFGGTLEPTSFIGSASGQVYRQRYDAADDTTPIPQFWEFPLKPWLGLPMNHHLDGIESFFQQVPSGPMVRLDVGVSDALAEKVDPNYSTVGHHDLNLTTRQKFNLPRLDMRFWSIRFAVTSSGPVQFLGGLANAWAEEAPEKGVQPAVAIDIPPTTYSPTTGAETLVITGVFPADYMVAIQTSWPTMYGVAPQSASQFTITFGTPVPPGGTVKVKVITA